ncbi:MAG: tetratricopeptide repeat protein, partial [Leptospiraceae bacterium]|nr:tetratricopeptide repeat protein [Leptospiraceae bacterium]
MLATTLMPPISPLLHAEGRSDAEQLNREGVDFFQSSNYYMAFRLFARAAELQPANAEYHNNMGMCLLQMNRNVEAAQKFREAIARNELALYYFNLSLAYEGLGELEPTVAALKKAIQLEPRHYEAHVRLGLLYMSQRDYTAAEPVLSKAAEMRDDPDVEYNLGVAYLQLNRSEKAVAHLKNATRMRPTFAAAHYNLGVALQQLNRLPEAQGSYTQCVQLNPGYT